MTCRFLLRPARDLLRSPVLGAFAASVPATAAAKPLWPSPTGPCGRSGCRTIHSPSCRRQTRRWIAGGSDALWLVDDDVANAEYFTYAITSATAAGFTVRATANDDWAEDATITYVHSGADGSTGDVGQPANDPKFTEAGF